MNVDEALKTAGTMEELKKDGFTLLLGSEAAIVLAAEVRRLQHEDGIWSKHSLCEIVERAEKAEAEVRRLREELKNCGTTKVPNWQEKNPYRNAAKQRWEA